MCVSFNRWFARASALALCGCMAVFSTSGPAWSQFHVEQPEVHKGELEAEYFGSYSFGLPRPPAETPRHGHALELSYGITSWWSLAVAAEAEQERNEENFSNIPAQALLQIIPNIPPSLPLAFQQRERTRAISWAFLNSAGREIEF